MSEWKEIRLGDIVSIQSGFAYKSQFIGEGNNYLLGMGCVSFKEKFLHTGARRYFGDFPERFIVRPGDLVLATRQQSDNLPILAMPAIVPDGYDGNLFIGANLYKVVNDSDMTNEFIYWLMKTPMYINYIKEVKTGSVVSMVTKVDVENFIFCCPPKETRDHIVSVIRSLDAKIENNNKVNAKLEEIAQNLFKEWFVDFGPFKDGKFVDSELGPIPEGWRVGTLGEIADNITDGVHNSVKDEANTSYYLLSCKNIKGGKLTIDNKERTISEDTFKQLRKRTKLAKGDILLSSVGTIGNAFK